jgi:ubiquitin-like-specific protease 1C/D
VCMPTKGADSGPLMLHLDSLGLHMSEKLFKTVARYVISTDTILRVWF